MRFAIVRGARNAREVWAYLPDNYTLLGGGPLKDGKRHEYIVGGLDSRGWTLGEYVIPRFSSGCIGCREITPTQAVNWLNQYSRADLYENGWLILDTTVEEQEPISVHKNG